jgi:hypothetical protein
VRVPPKVDAGRCVEIVPTEAGMAGIWGYVHAADGAALDQRLAALAATVCPNDPRTTMQRRADACGAVARGEQRLACQCGSADCAAVAERKAVADAVIHVLAEQATLDGTSDQPGYLPGFGIVPAESVRTLAKTATLKAADRAHRRGTGSGISAHRHNGAVHPVARSDLSVAGL